MKLSNFNIQINKFLKDIKSHILPFIKGKWSVCANSLSAHKNTLLKVVLPLLIIGAGYYACSQSQSAISKNMEAIFSISDNIRAYYSDKPDYWGVSTQSLIDNKVIPSKFIHQNKIMLSGKTEILIGNGEKADVVMPLSQYFDIVMPKLNKAQCMSYAEAPLMPEDSLKVYSIRIINTLGNYLFEWGGERPLPIVKYDTKDLCLDGENTLIWSIR